MENKGRPKKLIQKQGGSSAEERVCLPDDKSGIYGMTAIAVTNALHVSQSYMPPAEELRAYREIDEKLFDVIVSMAQTEQQARIAQNQQAQDAYRQEVCNRNLKIQNEGKEIERLREKDRLDSLDTTRGQYLGFAGLAMLIISAVFLVIQGNKEIAALFLGAGIIGIIGKFLVNKFSSPKR